MLVVIMVVVVVVECALVRTWWTTVYDFLTEYYSCFVNGFSLNFGWYNKHSLFLCDMFKLCHYASSPTPNDSSCL